MINDDYRVVCIYLRIDINNDNDAQPPSGLHAADKVVRSVLLGGAVLHLKWFFNHMKSKEIALASEIFRMKRIE